MKLSPDGKVLMKLGTAGIAGGDSQHLTEPSDVITAPNGDIFVADGHSGQNAGIRADYVTRIVKYSKDGKFLKQWGTHGTAPGQFRTPHALALDSRGRLFVADRGNSRIQIFDQNGTFLDEWRQFGRPSGLFIDKNDTLYAIDADSSAANHPGWKKGVRIRSANTGKVTQFVPGHQTDNHEGAAGESVIVDVSGNLYAAENTRPRGITKYPKR
jgi:sugar lactone lactonase YvrE